MRTAKVAFVLSCFLLTDALIGILRPGHSWVPHEVALYVAIAVVAGWLVCIHLAFRWAGLPRRTRVAGWLIVAGLFCYAAAREQTRYYLLGCWASWQLQLKWSLIGCFGLFAFLALAALILRLSEEKEAVPTPFTVESEHPDHVLHLDQTSRPDRLPPIETLRR